jgi:hypothetical protein
MEEAQICQRRIGIFFCRKIINIPLINILPCFVKNKRAVIKIFTALNIFIAKEYYGLA